MSQLARRLHRRPGLTRPATVLLFAAGFFALAAPVAAQFSGPVSPGSLGSAGIPAKSGLENAMNHGRWHLGPLVVGPWLELEDISYVDNVYGTSTSQTSDVTTTVRLGLHAHLPLSSKIVLGVAVLPAYTFWADLDKYSDWNMKAAAGLFGYFDRLTIELRALDTESQRSLATDLGPPVKEEARTYAGSMELRLVGRLAMFVSGNAVERSYDDYVPEDSEFINYSFLDRDETTSKAGLRYRLNPNVAVGVGFETSEVTFHEPTRDRSNSGDGGLLDLELGFGAISLKMSYANMTLKPEGSSEFVEYNGLLGRSQLRWRAGAGIEGAVYAGRSLSFGYTFAAVTEDWRYGASVSIPLGWRFKAGGYAETGTISYAGIPGQTPVVEEDVTAYEVSVGTKLWDWSLITRLSRAQYSGYGGSFERTVNRFSIVLTPPGSFQAWW